MGVQLRELGRWAGSRKMLAAALVAFTLSIGILIGTVVSDKVGAARPVIISGATPLVMPTPVSMSSAFAEIVNRDEPAVVNISTTQVIARKTPSQQRPGAPDPFQVFFNRFFGAVETGP